MVGISLIARLTASSELYLVATPPLHLSLRPIVRLPRLRLAMTLLPAQVFHIGNGGYIDGQN